MVILYLCIFRRILQQLGTSAINFYVLYLLYCSAIEDIVWRHKRLGLGCQPIVGKFNPRQCKSTFSPHSQASFNSLLLSFPQNLSLNSILWSVCKAIGPRGPSLSSLWFLKVPQKFYCYDEPENKVGLLQHTVIIMRIHVLNIPKSIFTHVLTVC